MSSKSSKTEARSRRDDLPDDLPETVAVGRVLRPHGVRGEVVVEVLSDVPGRFDPGERAPGRPARAEATAAAGSTVASRPAPQDRRAWSVSRGSPTATGPRSCAGLSSRSPRSQVPPAQPGTYYHYELLGCRCFDGGRSWARWWSWWRTAAGCC